MKHGIKPTRAQKKLIEEQGLALKEWLVAKDTPNEVLLVNRKDETKTRRIAK